MSQLRHRASRPKDTGNGKWNHNGLWEFEIKNIWNLTLTQSGVLQIQNLFLDFKLRTFRLTRTTIFARICGLITRVHFFFTKFATVSLITNTGSFSILSYTDTWVTVNRTIYRLIARRLFFIQNFSLTNFQQTLSKKIYLYIFIYILNISLHPSVPIPFPVYPSIHLHLTPLTPSGVQWARAEQPPFWRSHAEAFRQNRPSPSCPAGHEPHS